MANILKVKSRWLPFLLNTLGLGIAFSVFLILMSQVWWDFRYDRFKGGADVYQLEAPAFREGLFEKIVPRAVIQIVADCSPDIAVACDYVGTRDDRNGFVAVTNPMTGKTARLLHINYAFTETAALDVFNVSMVVGGRESFSKKGDVLISESVARALYPDQNPVGEPVFFLRDEYRISGIYRDRRENETLVNGFLFHEGEKDLALPNEGMHACYLKLRPGADLAAVREAVGKVSFMSLEDMRITQIHDAWFEKDLDRWGMKEGGDRLLCLVLVAIALLFLVIAAFNYVNFAMASIPLQIKGINVRKVLGASRKSLVLAQLSRSFTVTGLAFLVGVLVMRTLSGTEWSSFLSGNLDPASNGDILLIGGGMALTVALVTGLVPGLYGSSFQPALVLKGSFALTARGGGLRTVTTTLQFVLSFVFLLCALVLQRQTSFLTHYQGLGFDHDRVLYVRSQLFSQIGDVVERVRQIPGVLDVTRGESPIQESLSSMTELREGDDIVQYHFRTIPPEYPSFFRLELADGRLPLPGENGVTLVNESFLEVLPSYGIGQKLFYYDGPKTVIGVLKDFHTRSLENDFAPYAFHVEDDSNYDSFMIRIAPNADAGAILQKACEIYGGMKGLVQEEMEAGFLDQDIEKLYEQERRQTRLIRVSSLLSLIIAIIGILGLVWFDMQYMRKEIALRKINGATVGSLLSLFNRKYLLIAVVAFVAAVPASVAISRRWLEHFAFRTDIPAWIFLAALAAVLLLTLGSVSLQTWRAASANPVEAIKNE